jgi:cobalamin 5'-phosphate synthase/cobalamin synthase
VPTSPATTSTSRPPDISRGLPWFPLVGGLIGAGLALVDRILTPVFALPVRDALLLALAALVTGMLHLDGFVDCCDALLGTRSMEDRLRILRDSRVGAYGALGAALLLIIRYAALGELLGPVRVLALIAAPTLGRWAIVFALARYPYAREAGLGSAFPQAKNHLLAATGIAFALLLLLASVVTSLGEAALLTAAVFMGLLAAATLAVTLAWCTWASRRLGGLTGDTYGALCELVELAVLSLAPAAALLAGQFTSILSILTRSSG